MPKVPIIYAGTAFLGLVVVLFGIWVYYPLLFKKSPIVIVSPVPGYLTMVVNNQVTGLDVWEPSTRVLGVKTILEPEIQAKSAIIYDLTTDTMLFAKNSQNRLPMASITKIMTAIIALENKRDDDKYKVTRANLVGENSMGVTQGEIVSLEELLYGLMLSSGNDAAEVLASNYPHGGRSQFIAAMNNKAKALGLIDTNFTNPSGLQGDGNQYTTASDLLVVTRYALQNFSLFRTVVSTFSYTIPYTQTHKAFYLENETNLLTSYRGVKGVKTGFTPEAGLCLVTYLDYGGHQIIGVLLGSENRRAEMRELLDYSLRRLGIDPPPHG